jgi:hypothetical protein
MRRVFFVLVAALAAAPARADCDHFKWSVARERALFSASSGMLPAVGGQSDLGKSYALTLAKDAKLPVPPERAPRKDSFAGVLSLPKLEAGLYQITLSQEAWIDVAQEGALVKSSDFSAQRDRPGVRKTVRFRLVAGAAAVEISNAGEDKILIAVSTAE